MTKTAVVYTRVPQFLKEQVDEAAEQRGMNTSEFVRYVLHRFFDLRVDSETQTMYHAQEATE